MLKRRITKPTNPSELYIPENFLSFLTLMLGAKLQVFSRAGRGEKAGERKRH